MDRLFWLYCGIGMEGAWIEEGSINEGKPTAGELAIGVACLLSVRSVWSGDCCTEVWFPDPGSLEWTATG